jgi:hypothetical protein
MGELSREKVFPSVCSPILAKLFCRPVPLLNLCHLTRIVVFVISAKTSKDELRYQY